MSKIDEIVEQVEAMHPYKQSGNRDSYSEYNEGWSDACDIVQQRLEVLAPYIELAELYINHHEELLKSEIGVKIGSLIQQIKEQKNEQN